MMLLWIYQIYGFNTFRTMATAAPLIADTGKGDLEHNAHSSDFLCEKQNNVCAETVGGKMDEAGQDEKYPTFYTRYRPYILSTVAATILGWWISATILPATRHRWYAQCRSVHYVVVHETRIIQTFFAWAFILWAGSVYFKYDINTNQVSLLSALFPTRSCQNPSVPSGKPLFSARFIGFRIARDLGLDGFAYLRLSSALLSVFPCKRCVIRK